MEDSSALMIMKAIGDAKSELKEDIGKVTTTVAGFSGELKSVKDRVKTIEDDTKFKDRLQLTFAICILPIIAVVHQIAAHFGWIK